MNTRQLRKRNPAAYGKNTYEGTLTEKQRRVLYRMLRSEMPFDEVLDKAPPWGSGPDAGKQPSLRTLYNINERLELEAILVGLEGTSALVGKTTKELRPFVNGDGEQILDRALELIGSEVIRRTLYRLNPGARTAAARLLLKRADQRRVDRRLDMLEADFKKGTEGKSSLTGEEKEERMDRLFGK